MSNAGKKIRIPLTEKQALDLLLKVKPTAEMPKAGLQRSKPAAKPKWSK